MIENRMVLDDFESKDGYVGECEQCGERLYSGYEIYTDESGNLYCCLQCAIDANGIKEYEC